MPHPAAQLGAMPSHVCRVAERDYSVQHSQCTGAWQKRRGLFRAPEVVVCTCSCHDPIPKPPKVTSGGSDVDRRTRDLAEWYAGVVGVKPTREQSEILEATKETVRRRLAEALDVPEELLRSEVPNRWQRFDPSLPPMPSGHRPNQYPMPKPGEMTASGGGWRVPPEQRYDFGIEAVVPDDEHMPRVTRGSAKASEIDADRAAFQRRVDRHPEVEPEAARVFGWIDEAQHFEETGELFPVDSAYEISTDALRKMHEALHSAAEESFALTGDGRVTETCRLEDEVASSVFGQEFLLSGRQAGKGASMDRWRANILDEMEQQGRGMIATILSKATVELARRQLDQYEVEAVRAFRAGKGLAVIRGPLQQLEEGASENVTIRIEDSYLATKEIPAGVVYDFPSIEAFHAWQERNDA